MMIFLLLIFFIFTLLVIVMKIVYIMRKCLSMADLIDFKNILSSIYRWIWVYTQYINRKYNRSGRLWQNRFFSSVVEKEPYLWAVMRYIEQNPVRAKLVKRAEDYQCASARAHISGIKDDLLSTESWVLAPLEKSH